MFQHRSNIEKALSFLKKKSVNNTLKGQTVSTVHHNFITSFIYKAVLLVLNREKIKHCTNIAYAGIFVTSSDFHI